MSLMRKIDVKVITRAKKEGIEEISRDNYRIKISCTPEKGKANKKITEILSREFKIKKQGIRIVKGLKSSKKIIEIKK